MKVQFLTNIYKNLTSDDCKALENIILRYNIDTPNRLAAFVATAAVETGAFRRWEENLMYSAERLAVVWPKRFGIRGEGIPPKPNELAMEVAKNPEKIANIVYANRMGNGDEASGDGWRYRGRGAFMLTGRQNYETFGSLLKFDYVLNPELVAQLPHRWLTAAEYWRLNRMDYHADNQNLRTLRMIVNGGLIGFDEFKANYHKIKQLYA